MKELGDWAHWLLALLVFGGLYVIFARNPQETSQLAQTGVATYGGLASATNTLGNTGGMQGGNAH